MKQITLKLTVDELRLLANLASDQLFRREFIDPKMPGYKPNPEEVNIGKALVARLKLLIDDGSRHAQPAPAVATGYPLSSPVKRNGRTPDAL